MIYPCRSTNDRFAMCGTPFRMESTSEVSSKKLSDIILFTYTNITASFVLIW
jgi:hypothetical protein